MNTETNLDPMARKLDEYEGFPGLVLGLDGWLLRSLTPEHRPRFLNGYEKLLQVAFHPDRVMDPALKPSRDRYLRMVSESVAFLLRGELEYALALEDVPTRRNPMIKLQHELNKQEEVIKRLDEERLDPVMALDKERQEWKAKGERFRQQIAYLENINYSNQQLQRVTSQISQGIPTPLRFEHVTIKGYWMTEHFKELTITFSTTLHLQSALGHEFRLNPMRSHNKETISLEKGCIVGTKKRLVGAMSFTHLLEFARRELNYPELVTEEEAAVALSMFRRNLNEEEDAAFRLKLHSRMLPFYVPGMFLVFREWFPNTQSTRYDLLLAKYVDSSVDRTSARENGLRKCLDKTEEHLVSESRRADLLSRKLSNLDKKEKPVRIQQRTFKRVLRELDEQLRRQYRCLNMLAKNHPRIAKWIGYSKPEISHTEVILECGIAISFLKEENQSKRPVLEETQGTSAP